ncbi:hypothetical protein F5880DRAFT_1475925, partial [Lentinula raphanica]
MVSCLELYRISERLCKICNNPDIAFGGMNMIFAGDFAQLPPVGGESVSLYTHRAGIDSKTLNGQRMAIGKSLWHMITVVVILRKNMRNQGEDKQDIQFRKALENMRYKACTKDDIKCLNALVSANKPNRHYIACEPWRSAPIIIGENKQRDEINRLGAMRFAMDTKQKLTAFYSEDTICSAAGTKTDSKPTNRTKKSKVNTMNQDLQNILWDLPASTHEFHSPSMLPLCKGMPVIIRHNFATEMNITKGQRGFVFSWQSKRSTADKDHIEVLFVLLHNPPSPVQIEGLPLNVVPIVSRESKGYITLPDDTKIYVSRKQVDVLLGFAMTAYASQGQSLSPNATDLNTLNDHHAFYTALSRSRSYEKTIILQGFNHTCITGGASGALRK